MPRREADIVVFLTWILLSLFGSLPYLFSQAIPSFVNAFFESVSGFTTTGSSILTDIESLPKSILFWRSFTHWIGGIGIIVLVIIIMPGFRMGGYQLFSLESSLQEKMKPRIRSVGKRLLMIYLLLTFVESILLLLGGMNWFESLCHAFGTVATGGFSPKNDSIAGYSPYIQYVVMIFMVLGGTNFLVHYYILKGRFSKLRFNEELKLYLKLLFTVGAVITAILIFKSGLGFESAFRESFFQVISIITCTGYATADYLLWPSYAIIIIFIVMFLGGSTGSTSGGIKIVRHLMVFKNLKRFLIKMASPHAIIPIKLNGQSVTEKENLTILNFIVLYFLIFMTGSMILIFTGLDLPTAFSSVATAMAGIGPGMGSVGPASNFAHLTDFVKYVLTFLMIVGRLEIYTVLILFTLNFWKR
jgi:trk system potassium uptake protein TrkH